MTITGARPTRSHRRATRPRPGVLAGIGALSALVVLVVGVPIALVATTGWPWPRSLPSAQDVGQHLLQPDDGQLLATVLIAVAWLAWVVFTAGVVVESAAQLRGITARRLPLIGSAQALVAPLVTAAALLAHSPAASTVALVTAPTAASSPAMAAEARIEIPSQTPPASADTGLHVDVSSRDAGFRLYIVKPPHDGTRDTLWSIAAKHLGDPLRWREIAHLNHDRPQLDGGRLTDPHWIRPGWRLLMPPDASDLPLADPPAERSSHHPVEKPARTSAHEESAARTLPQTVTEPASQHPTRSADRTDQPTVHSEEGEPALPISLAMTGVLAAGVLALLGRRRAVQRRHRRTAERIRHAPPEAARAEIRLRAAADPSGVDSITSTLRALAALGSRESGNVITAELSPNGLEFLLDGQDKAPAAFIPVPGTNRWKLDPRETENREPDIALPAFASIGHHDGRLVFVDLERLGSLSLTGDAATADRLLSWIAADLAVGAWATAVNVTLVGVAPPLMALDKERVRAVGELTEDVVTCCERHVATFEASGYDDALETRAGDPLEPWPVEVVLIGSSALASVDRSMLDRLLRCASTTHRAGMAVVIAGRVESAAIFADIDSERIRVRGLSIEAQVAQLPEDQVASLDALLQSTADLESVAEPSPLPPVYPTNPPEPDGGRLTDPAEDDLDRQVEAYLAKDPSALRIQLLGPVSVNAPGELEPKRLPTATELIVYLACSPHGATLTDVDDALWPERIVPRTTRNALITRARAWVGSTADDAARLGRVDSNGRLHLNDALIDWDIFERLIRRARQRTGRERIEDLRRALSLVRGKPFESIPPGRYAWLAGRNLEELMSAAVIDAAHELAEELLDAGEATDARNAARTAQLVDRHDERPWRDLLRAEAALGRPRKVREHVRSMMRMLDVDVADQLMPETARLIDELTRAEKAAATG